MALGRSRAGAATEPTVTDNGTDNDATDPRRAVFTTPAKPVIVSVPGSFNAAVRVKINAAASNDFDNDSDDDGPGYFTVAIGGATDVSLGGIVAVESVSFITQNAGDDLDDVSVVGWPA